MQVLLQFRPEDTKVGEGTSLELLLRGVEVRM